ncbi:MAG: MFS transporter [Fibrobacteres bacterium]|nr:MFS transporter [Fibrobacterota bacterium]
MTQHKRFTILYLFPLAFDIIVSVSLFAGRHSLAEQGLSAVKVGSILTMYGVGYVLANVLMARIIKPDKARMQMVLASVITAAILVLISQIRELFFIQVTFILLPIAVSFFFNAFQNFMLTFDSGAGKPLTRTVAYYTGAWSIGYALGPIVASFVKENMGWPSAYIAASIVAGAIGIVAMLFKPESDKTVSSEKIAPIALNHESKSLAPAAWIGVVTGWTALNVIFTYWPLQAEAFKLNVQTKGAVEFTFAMAQSLASFALAGVSSSYYFNRKIPWIGLLGVISLIMFALVNTPLLFIAAAAIFGIYTAHILNSMVFHSMIDKSKAVKRIAINEVCVGSCFLMAAPIAGAMRHLLPAVNLSYFGVAFFVLSGITLQSLVMSRLKKG